MLCLVTDRRRLAPGVASLEAARRCVLEQAQYAVDARIDLIHLRERDLLAADLAALAADLLRITRRTATRVVINDRIDIALACGADGVHLRADAFTVTAARRLVPPPFLIGRSVHSVSDAAAAAGADYIVAGTVFPTASKGAASACIGVGGLRAIVRAAAAPVLAIGGISIDRAGELAAAGAAGIAGIGLFMAPETVASSPCRAVSLADRADAVRDQFDSGRVAS
jgi:thiamine-phosphate pyrophosphorylase